MCRQDVKEYTHICRHESTIPQKKEEYNGCGGCGIVIPGYKETITRKSKKPCLTCEISDEWFKNNDKKWEKYMEREESKPEELEKSEKSEQSEPEWDEK